MQWITVATPPFESIDKFDALQAKMSGAPDGLEARYVGTADGKLRIVSLWESKAHADRFFTETLPPLLTEVLGPEPVGAAETIGIDVTRSYTREPVA